MAQFAIPLIIASSALQAIGAIQQGNAARKAAEFNAAVAEQNARVARQAAAADAEAQQRDARRRLGAIRAAYGASGVSAEGSPLDVLEDSAAMAELDKQNILYKGELRAIGFESTAALERFSGRNAQRAGYMGAAATLLGGVGNAFFKKPMAGQSISTGSGLPPNSDPGATGWI